LFVRSPAPAKPEPVSGSNGYAVGGFSGIHSFFSA
jgi:hypothetical protein